MSTDHQRYSTENQSAAIREYAIRHGMEVVRTYADEGRSGLDIDGREALKRLIADIKRGPVDYRVILVYDISRWGRFQNADEGAHYEYLCTAAGIRVIYCAEQFSNDGTPVSAIIKSVKRAMAGEYSRELSSKVFAGQCRLVEKGFHQGGAPGYGLRRELFDEQGNSKGLLNFREQKSIQTDRVVLTPGPETEIEVVARIYRLFVQDGLLEREIADRLNTEGIRSELDRPWSRGAVHQVLTNEKYIGNNVYNRVSSKLKQRTVRNPPEKWIRRIGAWKGIVSTDIFTRAREVIAQRSLRLDDAEMLQLLKALLERAGDLSGLIIDEQDNMPSSSAYQSRFGGLLRAYELIGYRPEHDYRYLEVNKALRAWRPSVVAGIVDQLRAIGAHVDRSEQTDLLTINGEWNVSIVVSRCQITEAGGYRWRVAFDSALAPDVTIAVRMDQANQVARDYYFIPRIDIGAWPQRIAEENDSFIDAYRFDSLEFLSELAGRSPSLEAA